MFVLSQLPYPKDALVPVISEETIEYHYGKHHNTYVTNLNNLLQTEDGKPFLRKSLEEIILNSKGAIFNNAAQVWNHTFYWNCLTPKSSLIPNKSLLQAIEKKFNNFDNFKKIFGATAMKTFGSGWVWLVKDNMGELKITNTIGAACPLTDGEIPLLTCDVWEHAYYIDYRNNRQKYVENFWSIVNWNFVIQQFEK